MHIQYVWVHPHLAIVNNVDYYLTAEHSTGYCHNLWEDVATVSSLLLYLFKKEMDNIQYRVPQSIIRSWKEEKNVSS